MQAELCAAPHHAAVCQSHPLQEEAGCGEQHRACGGRDADGHLTSWRSQASAITLPFPSPPPSLSLPPSPSPTTSNNITTFIDRNNSTNDCEVRSLKDKKQRHHKLPRDSQPPTLTHIHTTVRYFGSPPSPSSQSLSHHLTPRLRGQSTRLAKGHDVVSV